MATTQTPLMTTPQVASLLGVSKRTVQELVTDRKLGFIKFGRNVRFSQSDIDKFVESNSTRPVGWKAESNRGDAQ